MRARQRECKRDHLVMRYECVLETPRNVVEMPLIELMMIHQIAEHDDEVWGRVLHNTLCHESHHVVVEHVVQPT